MISIIVATDKNGVIGQGNNIPWRVRSDLKALARSTKGHTVILGRKTYDSMHKYYNGSGRQMPGKTYIVITRQRDYTPERENACVAHSIEEAIAIAKQLGDDSIFAIGGAAIYKAILPFTDQIRLTEVQTRVQDGDTYFSELNNAEWSEISREHYQKDDINEFNYDFIVLQRIK